MSSSTSPGGSSLGVKVLESLSPPVGSVLPHSALSDGVDPVALIDERIKVTEC